VPFLHTFSGVGGRVGGFFGRPEQQNEGSGKINT